MIDRFLYWGKHVEAKSGKIKGSCQPPRPDVYKFSRVVFGKNSAPMESQFVAQENARKHQEEYTLAAETVLKSTYMDDSLDSVGTVEDGIQLYHQLDSVWGDSKHASKKGYSMHRKSSQPRQKLNELLSCRSVKVRSPLLKRLEFRGRVCMTHSLQKYLQSFI